MRTYQSYSTYLRLTETLCQVCRHLCSCTRYQSPKINVPIFLTVRAEKETRNRYFLVDSLRDASPADAKLFRKMRSKPSIRSRWPEKIPKRSFLLRGSGPHYQEAYSSWLIIEFDGIRERSRYRARSCGGPQ